jgi:hypothetical protein
VRDDLAALQFHESLACGHEQVTITSLFDVGDGCVRKNG